MRLAVVGCVLGAAGPASALADTVAIGTSADPVEDVTYQITVSGSTNVHEVVFATIKAAGGRTCAANRAADDGSSVFSAEGATGQFSVVRNWTTYDSGTYLLCAWAGKSSSDPPTAVAQQLITVRAPYSTGSVAVPSVVTGGAVFQMSVTAQTEVRRGVFVEINRPGIACAPNLDANREWADALNGSNTGGPFVYTSNVRAPTAPGDYGVCGYFQEDSDDTVPEATFGAAFHVISPRCPSAQRAHMRYARRISELGRTLQGRVLRRGHRGRSVAQLQRRLDVQADAVFGPRTERAVKRFQRLHRLPVTGVVDVATRRALRLPPFISRSARERYVRELGLVRRRLAKAKRDIDQFCV